MLFFKHEEKQGLYDEDDEDDGWSYDIEDNIDGFDCLERKVAGSRDHIGEHQDDDRHYFSTAVPGGAAT